MKNTFKRIVAIALVVLMCVSAVVPAFAAGNACPGYGNTHNTYNCTYVEADKQEATCSNDGHVTGKCVTCGTIFSASQTKALGHTWEVQPTVCTNNYTKKCTVCEAVETIPNSAIDHLYTAYTLNEGVTECNPGERVTKICVYCGDVQTTQITDEGHVFSVVSYTEPATCIDLGVAKLECIVAGCDATKDAVVLPENPTHSFVAWDADALGKDANKVDPTCQAAGRKTMICSDCNLTTVVSVAKDPCTLYRVDATAATCERTGVKAHYWCADCKTYYDATAASVVANVTVGTGDDAKFHKLYKSSVAPAAIVDKDWTVVPSLHDTITERPETILEFVVPDCVGDGYISYRCTEKYKNDDGVEEQCDFEGEVVLPKYAKHLYYNDVTTVEQKADLLVALAAKSSTDALAVTEDEIKEWSDAKINLKWAELGEISTDATAAGKGLVWENYVPADCEENAEVTYICLNCTYNEKTDKYVFSDCDAADATKLTGEGFDAVGHKFAERYPLSSALTTTVKQTNDNGTPDDDTDDFEEEVTVDLKGTLAYTWKDGVQADCTTAGTKIYSCINELRDASGNIVGCTYGNGGAAETKTERVAKLGHDYQILAAEDVDLAGGEYKQYDTDGTTIKALNAIDLYNMIVAGAVRCTAPDDNSTADGKAYKVCTRCNLLDKKVVDVLSTGTEHKWEYLDKSGNIIPEVKDGDGNVIYVAGTLEALIAQTIATDATFGICVDTINAKRRCAYENCNAHVDMVDYVVPAKGHKFPDTSKEEVIDELVKLTVKGQTNEASENYAAGTFKLVSVGTCEEGAIYAIKCSVCNVTKSYEYTDGFKMGHNKVYVAGTAVAPTCTTRGYSNKWYCTNEICEYYAYVDTNGNLSVALSTLDSDVKYGTNHEIWDAKLGTKGNFRTVKYTDVADTKISEAQNVGAASKQFGPEAGVKAIAIEGTTVVWVYMYEAKDHTETDVKAGGLYCAACNTEVKNGTASILEMTLATPHVNVSDYYGFNTVPTLSKTVACDDIGYTYTTCNNTNTCYCVALDNFTEATNHAGGFNFINYNETKKKFEVLDNADEILDALIKADKQNGTSYVADNNLSYVEPGCLVPGYVIDKCQDCDLVVTVEIPVVPHTNKNNQELVDSCVNYVTNRVCVYCAQTIGRSHVADANGICKVCGLVDEK